MFWPHYVLSVESACNTNEYQGYLLGCKDGRCVGLTTLPSSCYSYEENLGASASWSPKALSRPVPLIASLEPAALLCSATSSYCLRQFPQNGPIYSAFVTAIFFAFFPPITTHMVYEPLTPFSLISVAPGDCRLAKRPIFFAAMF